MLKKIGDSDPFLRLPSLQPRLHPMGIHSAMHTNNSPISWLNLAISCEVKGKGRGFCSLDFVGWD
jgi:hypothetical protein